MNRTDILELSKKIELLHTLGEYLLRHDDRLEAHVHRASVANPWFTKEHVYHALDQIAMQFLRKDKLTRWLQDYPTGREDPMHVVGIVAAGNVPAVGFHDLLCTFLSGNISQVKLSDRDPYLLPYLVKWMGEIEPLSMPYFGFVERLAEFQAVIATGSNNTSRYFEAYFGEYPHIIRRNRNAVAVLDGSEDASALQALGDDVFRYFGLGCRNVSQIWVPEGYQFKALVETFISAYHEIADHSKYRNNLDYNAAICILNRDHHIATEVLVLIESEQLISPVGTLHYAFYDDQERLFQRLSGKRDEIQCVVSAQPVDGVPTVPFGQAQQPELSDYADGVDTLGFLMDLKVEA